MTLTIKLNLMPQKRLFRIIVSGWRELPPIGFVEDKLGQRIQHLRQFGEVEIVVGDAWGVDKVVRDWCKFNKIDYKEFKADWTKFGVSAGPRRNREMAKYAMEVDDYELMAFPHRLSRGTKDMIEWAEHKNIPTRKFEILL